MSADDCIGYAAEGADPTGLFGKQYDPATFPLTEELKAKGLAAEDWEKICTSLREAKSIPGISNVSPAHSRAPHSRDISPCARCAQRARYLPFAHTYTIRSLHVNQGFSEAIGKANDDYLTKIGCVGAYAEYGLGQKAFVVMTKEVADGGRVAY